MVNRLLGTRRGAHSRGSHDAAEDRLRALSRQLRPAAGGPSWGQPRRWLPSLGGLGGVVALVVVAAIVIYVAVQWFRPLPSASLRAETSSLRLAGTAPSLPWPATGAAAMSEVGVGSLGHVGTTAGLPTASMIKVLTAYVVLQDHPLAAGSDGPSIVVTPDVVSAYQAGVASQQSEVQVSAGESLTEMQVLEGMLVASGNDMALLLADWDAGSLNAFLAKENAEAQKLGLTATHVTDPAGLDPATVSSAEDLVHLGELAMANPTIRQIVAMPEITLPEAGSIYNFDYAVGHDGIIGIKTGSDAAAGGCFLFAAERTVSGKTVTLVGVVLGQTATPMLGAALSAGEALVNAAFANLRPLPLVAPGQQVGTVRAPWGAKVGVTVRQAPTVVAVPGTQLEVTVRKVALGSSVSAGAKVGELEIHTESGTITAPLTTTGVLPGPSVVWRLTRL
jgi:D-alanyl-D-alanine carboxypeptidase (penicillin-binding protein 5/6)